MADKTKPPEQELEQMAPAADEQQPKAKRKLPLPKWAIIAVVLLAQVVGSYYLQKSLFFRNDAGAAEVKKEPKEEKVEPPPEFPIVMLDEIVVNPAETSGRRYLAVTMGLQTATPESPTILEKKKPVIRDALISLLSSKYLDQLASIQYRDSLKMEIRDTLNKQLNDSLISNVVFTGYVLQ